MGSTAVYAPVIEQLNTTNLQVKQPLCDRLYELLSDVLWVKFRPKLKLERACFGNVLRYDLDTAQHSEHNNHNN